MGILLENFVFLRILTKNLYETLENNEKPYKIQRN